MLLNVHSTRLNANVLRPFVERRVHAPGASGAVGDAAGTPWGTPCHAFPTVRGVVTRDDESVAQRLMFESSPQADN